MQVRVGTTLTTAGDWLSLVDGTHDAIRLSAFASPGECAKLLETILNHPEAEAYKTAAGVIRLGSSFSDIRKSGALESAYMKQDLLVAFLSASPAISRLFGQLTCAWPYGTETLIHAGYPLHRLVARRIGNGASPHDDNVSKEVPENAMAASVRVQLGVNLYVEIPDEGGELEGWRTSLSKDEYDRLRDPEPTRNYGLRRADLGPPDWAVRPKLGDVIVFRNSEVHAIGTSSAPRSSCGFFLGFRDSAMPLLVWS